MLISEKERASLTAVLTSLKEEVKELKPGSRLLTPALNAILSIEAMLAATEKRALYAAAVVGHKARMDLLAARVLDMTDPLDGDLWN